VRVDRIVTWQRIVFLTGQTWTNDCLTSVTIVDELNGAMWPSHGPPRGTPILVVVVKIFGLHQSRSCDLWAWVNVLGKAELPACQQWNLTILGALKYLR
jgi:hypothetical protein